ncbi:MAG: SAM-dependent methyltransferase [Promethearchaeota archaeon]|nr:MAG: SAM-dependent methyltransferase [Candidatus Lokiarchaeota archaeon]
MKEIDGVKYFNVEEISNKLGGKRFDQERINSDFEKGIIKGKKIDGEWHTTAEQFGEYTETIENELVKFTEMKEIDLSDIKLDGRVLDIGGGGEGTIGQMIGRNVVAIDLRESEFRESIESGDTESLKIIMDAKELKFMDNTFEAVSVFFTFLYIPKEDRLQVFKEIKRVLKPGGALLIWDLEIPEKSEKDTQSLYGIKLKIDIGKKKIETGYGTRWVQQDAQYYIDLAKTVGLKLEDKKVEKGIFYLKFKE